MACWNVPSPDLVYRLFCILLCVEWSSNVLYLYVDRFGEFVMLVQIKKKTGEKLINNVSVLRKRTLASRKFKLEAIVMQASSLKNKKIKKNLVGCSDVYRHFTGHPRTSLVAQGRHTSQTRYPDTKGNKNTWKQCVTACSQKKEGVDSIRKRV